ncbi:hypothetical protein RYX36_033040 [Vicia faba]
MAPPSIVSNGTVTPTVTSRFASVYSEVQNSRVDHKLRLPSVLQAPFAIVDGPKSSAAGNPDEIVKLFSFLFGQPSAALVPADSANALPHRKLKIGVVLSGGQAPGGHNVISGIYDYLQQRASGSTLYGFNGGPAGIMKCKYTELNSDYIYPYRNQGGFDMICSGRDKIETPEQFKQAEETVNKLDLDGLVVIGGDDSNTNACLLAENFREADDETRRLLIVLAGEAAQKREYVFFSEVQFISETDLQTIDKLWRKHSDNKFGYSVQKKLFGLFLQSLYGN